VLIVSLLLALAAMAIVLVFFWQPATFVGEIEQPLAEGTVRTILS
jgi:hypothetical protein